MRVDIDQSGKTEHTSDPTVIGDSLGNNILIKGVDKIIIQKIYRRLGKPRRFIIELFSLLISFIIKKSFIKNNVYIIDIEYPGYSEDIKNLIIKYTRSMGFKMELMQIRFGYVGRKSKAHATAYKRFKRRTKGETIKISKIKSILFQ